jgi:ATP-dependent DNA ligase
MLRTYLEPMFKSFEFCIPTRGIKVPAASEWFHEIKYDGYRLRVERDGGRVRLITRGGYDWTKRFPWIVEAARNTKRKLIKKILGSRIRR